MNLRDYFLGQPVSLRSPLRPGEVVDRINQAAKSRWWPLQFGEVVGSARFGKLALRYTSSPFEYNAKPILVGRIEVRGEGSVLNLSYRGHRSASAFFVIWYPLLLIFIGLFAVIGPDPDVPQENAWLPYLLFPVMLVFPLGLHFIGTRNSEDELQLLLHFLEESIQAR